MTSDRWEWRTFARSPAYSSLLSEKQSGNIRLSRELYILSLASPNNVKIRDDILDIKLLVSLDAAGLEQWRPVLKTEFPLDDDAMDAVWSAWGLPLPVVRASRCSREEFLDRIVTPEAALCAVHVQKRRSRITVEECQGEHVALTIGGEEWESISFEDLDPFRVWKAVRAIGLENAENTNYPAALKRIVGFNATAQSTKREDR